MAQLIFKNVFIEDAKEILSLAYRLDKSSTYANDLCVSGRSVTAKAFVNEAASKNSTVEKFDVTVESDVFEATTMKDHFNAFDFAL